MTNNTEGPMAALASIRKAVSYFRYFYLPNQDIVRHYRLPTILASYPRAGSNFLQMVVEKSSGNRCRSLYSNPFRHPEKILSLKSHAFSFELLFDELNRFVEPGFVPEKIVVLQRDPRDIMISFFEFVKARKEVDLSQEEFLTVDYFFATFSDKDRILDRRVELQPLDVMTAFRRFVYNWFIEPSEQVDLLYVSYERLVLEPEYEFGRVFDFLELDCGLNRGSLDRRVSQYSPSTSQRGTPQRWKSCKDTHGSLIDAVSDELGEAIRTLGYA